MKDKKMSLPSEDQLLRELEKEQYKQSYRRILRSTVFSLITLAAIVVLVVMLFMPVMRIYGTSMEPTLEEGEIVAAFKGLEFRRGDIVAFYYGNKLLVKRYIAGPGDWVNMDEDGNVFVNGEYLEESYLTEKAVGECNIELPYQVPEDKYFLMGDHRATSLDSRSTTVGCVGKEEIVGRIVFRAWPLDRFGVLHTGAAMAGGRVSR